MTKKQQAEIARIEAVQKAIDAEREAVLELPIDVYTEEEEDAILADCSRRMNLAIDAKYDAMKPFFKMNEWFQNFVNSFGDCKSKRITKKQAEIFEKYIPYSEQKNSFSSFHGKSFVVGAKYAGQCEGKVYELSSYENGSYVTIRDVITI